MRYQQSLPGPFFTRFAFQPASQIGLARVSIEASPRLRYGTVAAHRQYDQGSNSIIGADLVWQASPTLRSRAMAIQSRTTASFDEEIHCRRSPGNYLFFDTLAMGSHWETAWTAERATKDFRNDIGYTPAADFMQVAGVITRHWRPLGAINNIGAALKVVDAQTVSTDETISGPSSFIRYIGQSRSSRRYSSSSLGRPDALPTGDGWLLHDNRGVLHSLVCSLTLYRRWGVDFGVTRSQPRSLAEPRRRETSMFLKLEGNW